MVKTDLETDTRFRKKLLFKISKPHYLLSNGPLPFHLLRHQTPLANHGCARGQRKGEEPQKPEKIDTFIYYTGHFCSEQGHSM